MSRPRRRRCCSAKATCPPQRSQVIRARITYDDAKRDLERKESLVQKGFISTSERDKALFVEQGAAEAVRTAQAQVASAEAQVANARAVVKQREAALASARNDLSKTAITAPVDGVVISRQVEPGQTVAASLNTPTLFTIAQDLSQMQVDVAIDESDIGRIRAGPARDVHRRRVPRAHVRGHRAPDPQGGADGAERRDLYRGRRNEEPDVDAGARDDRERPHRHRPAQQRAQGAERRVALAAGRRWRPGRRAPRRAAAEGRTWRRAGAAPAPDRRAEARRRAGRARWTRSSPRCAPEWPSFARCRRRTVASAASACAPTCGRRSTRC